MNSIIGNNLRRLREANQFSQEQAASFLEIKRSTYSNYETGEREAPLAVLEKLTNLYGCELHLIFEEKEAVVEEILVCSFRTDNINEKDMKEIAYFKNVVMNYLKMDRLLQS